MTEQPRTPVQVIKSGALSVSIWRNEPTGENKRPWFNVTPQRAYEKNGEWLYVASFNRDDAPTLANLLNLAHGWIVTEDSKHANRGV